MKTFKLNLVYWKDEISCKIQSEIKLKKTFLLEEKSILKKEREENMSCKMDKPKNNRFNMHGIRYNKLILESVELNYYVYCRKIQKWILLVIMNHYSFIFKDHLFHF